ncbi:hypothetical protein CFOL_v3_28768, partial [Cephalotus follicularis]
ILFKPTAEKCRIILEILRIYEKALKQNVNIKKKSLFFNQDVHSKLLRKIMGLFGVRNKVSYKKTLGVPHLIGRRKMWIFLYIKDSIYGKLKRCKEKFYLELD